jgi:hypothetical protein
MSRVLKLYNPPIILISGRERKRDKALIPGFSVHIMHARALLFTPSNKLSRHTNTEGECVCLCVVVCVVDKPTVTVHVDFKNVCDQNPPAKAQQKM